MKAADILPTLQAHPDAEVYVAAGYDNTGVIESINYWPETDGPGSISIDVEA